MFAKTKKKISKLDCMYMCLQEDVKTGLHIILSACRTNIGDSVYGNGCAKCIKQ